MLSFLFLFSCLKSGLFTRSYTKTGSGEGRMKDTDSGETFAAATVRQELCGLETETVEGSMEAGPSQAGTKRDVWSLEYFLCFTVSGLENKVGGWLTKGQRETQYCGATKAPESSAARLPADQFTSYLRGARSSNMVRLTIIDHSQSTGYVLYGNREADRSWLQAMAMARTKLVLKMLLALFDVG